MMIGNNNRKIGIESVEQVSSWTALNLNTDAAYALVGKGSVTIYRRWIHDPSYPGLIKPEHYRYLIFINDYSGGNYSFEDSLSFEETNALLFDIAHPQLSML